MAKKTGPVLSAEQAAALQPAADAAVEQLLAPDVRPPNVVGVGVGVKWKDGEPTGEPAVLVLVTHKVAEAELADAHVVPKAVDDVRTDVVTVGYPMAGRDPTATAETLDQRVRPAQGGWSVGHVNITAGTIATCVYDFLPGATTNPPAHGVGIPAKYYILSNNHVLADVNAGKTGDAIVQPGPYDGGTDPADRIATLSRFIPITLDPATPLAQHRNLVDCALAEGKFSELDREIYWTGRARAWARKADVAVGTVVKKTGRTTNFTTGRIVAVNATIDVGYGSGRTGRFQDQIVTTNMSAGGDSGSLVLTLDDVAVGLLFAGSPASMIANQIENVRSLLQVEVAETTA
jgi:hypothetical protein